MNRISLACFVIASVMLIGCAQPKAAQPVAKDVDATVHAIGQSYILDLAAFRACIESSLAANEVLSLGELHRSLILEGYVSPDGSDTAGFRSDLADSTKRNAILNEVRLGRMSSEEAERWLSNYAAIMRASNGKPLRDDMLRGLAEGEVLVEARRAILQAFDEHAQSVATVLVEAGHGTKAMRDFTEAKYPLQEFLSTNAEKLWQSSVSAKLADKPKVRDAANDLFHRILGTENSSP